MEEEEGEGEGGKRGEGWHSVGKGFSKEERRVGLIAAHYLPKLPRRTNIRIKAAPNAPLRLLVQSLMCHSPVEHMDVARHSRTRFSHPSRYYYYYYY